MIRPPLAFFQKLLSRLGLLSLAGALLLHSGTADAASYWNGSSSGLWTTDANWSTDVNSGITATAPISTTDVFFSTTTPGPLNLGTTLGQNFSINSLSYLSTAATTSIGGGGVNTLTIGTGGITVEETAVAATHVITADVILGANQIWTIGSTSAASSTSFRVGGGISGAFSLTKAGRGVLDLGGTASYTGSTTVSAGTLFVNGGGQITDTSSILVDGLPADNAILTVDGATSSVATTGTLSIGTGSTNGTGALNILNGATVTSAGTTLIGNQSGGVTANFGTATVDGTGSTLTATAVSLGASSTLNIQNGAAVNIGAGAGTLTVGFSGGGPATLNIGAFAGGTTAGTLSAATLSRNGGPGKVNFNQTDASYTFAPNITGAIAVEQRGTGTTILTGTNSYAGVTTITTGVLQIGNGGTTGTLGSANVVNNATLNFNRSNPLAVANVISGTGAVNQNGTGTTTLSATNQTYTGATTVNAGTLELTGGVNSMYSSGVTAGQVTVNSGGTLLLSGTDTFGQSSSALNVVLTVNAGGTVKNGAGFYNPFRNAVFNGGTLETNNGVLADYQAFGLEGTVTIGGSSATNFSTVGTTNNGISIGRQGVAATTTFDVADATSSAAADLVVAVAVTDMGGQVSSLSKTGAGTMLFTAASAVSYTGTTSISAGGYVMNGTQTGAGNFTVDSGAMLAGAGAISTAAGQSMFLNGTVSVGDPTGVATAATFSLATSGGGSVVFGTGSVILMDVFTGAGAGDNTGNAASADRISLTGTLTTTTTGTLVLANPNALNSFAAGDQWKLFDLNAGAGSIVGDLTVIDTALGLVNGLTGEFDKLTGIYRIVGSTPQLSAQQSGLQTAAAQGQALMAAVQGMLGDINGRLFNLRAGWGEESDDTLAASMDDGVIIGQGDGSKNPVAKRVSRTRQWEFFTTVNYANINISTIRSQAGVQSQTWAPGVGIERHFSRSLTLGFAANLMETHQTYSGGLGTLDIEGVALSTYISYVRRAFWSDLLYSFGRFDLTSDRNPGFAFPIATGNTTAYTNAVQFNSGWNFRFQNNTLVTGPFVGLDYLHATVDSYSESGGGLAALAYNKRSYDSLISRVGWSVSKSVQTDFALITPQLRLSYERQNITNNNGTSVNLINQPFSATTNSQAPGQDYVVAGLGVNFQFTPAFNMLLTYQGQFFRQDMQAHYGSVRFGYKF